MKKVIITGATGFVGKNLTPFLEEHGFQCVPVSVRHNSQLEIPDDAYAIVHLSGKAHDISNGSDPESYTKANYELTRALYDISIVKRIPKFIFLSSVKAVADVTNGPLDESAPYQPATPYGRSKMMAEKHITDTPLQDTQKYYILRPCMIHGPGNKGNLNLLYKFAKLGIPYPLAAFDNRRSFLSVDNLNFVINELLQRDDVLTGIYHIADDESLSTIRLINIINSVLKKANRLLRLSPGFIRKLAKLGDALHLPFNSSRLQKLTDNYIVSNLKIKGALHKDLPVSAEAGLRRTIESFADA